MDYSPKKLALKGSSTPTSPQVCGVELAIRAKGLERHASCMEPQNRNLILSWFEWWVHVLASCSFMVCFVSAFPFSLCYKVFLERVRLSHFCLTSQGILSRQHSGHCGVGPGRRAAPLAAGVVRTSLVSGERAGEACSTSPSRPERFSSV